MLSAAQLEMRKTGIGGSEVAAVVGWSPWKTKMDVFEDKVGGTTVEPTAAMKAGTFFEDGIALMYAADYGVKLMRCLRTLRHPRHHWALATPDRFVLRGRKRDRLCEIKAPGHASGEWGPSGSDEIPRYYMSQVQWTMEVAGLDECDLVAYFLGSRDMRVYRVARNDVIIRYLLEEVEDFWKNHVAPRIPPKLDGGEGTDRYLKRVFPVEASEQIVAAPPEAEKWVRKYVEARHDEKEAKLRMDEASAFLKAMIGENAGIRSAGWCSTWRTNSGRGTDWQAAAAYLEVKIAEATRMLENMKQHACDAASVDEVFRLLSDAQKIQGKFKKPGTRTFDLKVKED